MSVLDIRSAICQERDATPAYYDFKVLGSVLEGGLCRVTIQPQAAYPKVVLDESLEDAEAWWPKPHKGSAKVLAVVAEEDQIILKGATSRPPVKDGLLRIYPPQYLDALLHCWLDSAWAHQAMVCLQGLDTPVRVAANPLSGHAFRWLRRAQRQALKLVQYSSSFLYGPPGTGKTTTLGVLLAEYLHMNPRARVLLLSTTNHAVDQATVAVDKALEQSKREALRKTIKRLGSRFVASHYVGREHLLPVHDKRLIKQLADLQAQRPSDTELAALSLWKEQVQALEQKLRSQSLEVLRQNRLACMTTTRAAFTLQDLRTLPTFDLVVFDEASQVGLAHALALMPLGRSYLFAGDPQQLSPVVRSAATLVQRWLGSSPFSKKPVNGPSVCFLDEQSRMAEPICGLVSHLFYDGLLRVAEGVKDDAKWLATRRREFAGIPPDVHVHTEDVSTEGGWSQTYNGPIRYESADRMGQLVATAVQQDGWDHKDIVVLTPFRAQRALIRRRLREHGVHHVKVSTVHRAQGSEVPVIIFDPVEAANPFLLSDEAKRLMNVAFSRAQAKVVLMHSPGDSANPLIDQAIHRVRLQAGARSVTQIEDLVQNTDFPTCTLGKFVQIGKHLGEVCAISRDGSVLTMRNANTGAEQTFMVNVLRAKGRASS